MAKMRVSFVLPLVAVVWACSHPTSGTALSTPPSGSATPAPVSSGDGDDVPITPPERERLLSAMIPLLQAHYLDPVVGQAMVETLRAKLAARAYADLASPRAFARAVTDDLRAVSHDRHVTLHYEDAQAKAGPSRDEIEHDKRLEADAGFVAVERWAGDVAYVRLDSFGPYADGVSGDAVYARQLSGIADAKALILDLRDNHGGYPEMVALLVSYLVDPPPIHLSDFWDHDDGTTSQSWTRATVGGTRFGGAKPIYVLVSHNTFSGAEEAAYDLQALKRAVVVGERTAGGANFAPRHKLDERFTFAVPQGRAINAVTKVNWEGTGVTPDVAVAAEDAGKEALRRATAQGR
jgi:retinol-binding protein 3